MEKGKIILNLCKNIINEDEKLALKVGCSNVKEFYIQARYVFLWLIRELQEGRQIVSRDLTGKSPDKVFPSFFIKP